MQRDLKLYNDIILYLENAKLPGASLKQIAEAVGGEGEEMLDKTFLHLKLLKNKGYIRATLTESSNFKDVYVQEIKSDGHDYLANLKK